MSTRRIGLPLLALALLTSTTTAVAKPKFIRWTHIVLNDNNWDCIKGLTDGTYDKPPKPIEGEARRILATCHDHDPTWGFCTSQDYYCIVFQEEGVMSATKALLVEAGKSWTKRHPSRPAEH
jgi:hypothetical protein